MAKRKEVQMTLALSEDVRAAGMVAYALLTGIPENDTLLDTLPVSFDNEEIWG